MEILVLHRHHCNYWPESYNPVFRRCLNIRRCLCRLYLHFHYHHNRRIRRWCHHCRIRLYHKFLLPQFLLPMLDFHSFLPTIVVRMLA